MPEVKVHTLRISVTDQCNLRCIYCNPLGHRGFVRERDMLRLPEIQRLVSLCTNFGVQRVRLTGGEPLLRENIVDLIRSLAAIPEIEDLALTTNGIRFEPMATDLQQAGLQRINISLDAADGPCYRQMTEVDGLNRVKRSIQKAIDVGLTPVRINCVVLPGMNLTQVPRLAAMSVDQPVSVRFIEYYAGPASTESMHGYVPNREVRRLIEAHLGSLSPVVVANGSGPAVYFNAAQALGTIGFISGRSSEFCHSCSRLRLTCDGQFKLCLHSDRSYDVKRPLRSNASDEALLSLIGDVFRAKRMYLNPRPTLCGRSMQHIGG